MPKAWLVHHRMLQLPIICHIERDAIHVLEVFNQRFGGRPGYIEDVDINFALPMAGQITLGRGDESEPPLAATLAGAPKKPTEAG